MSSPPAPADSPVAAFVAARSKKVPAPAPAPSAFDTGRGWSFHGSPPEPPQRQRTTSDPRDSSLPTLRNMASIESFPSKDRTSEVAPATVFTAEAPVPAREPPPEPEPPTPPLPPRAPLASPARPPPEPPAPPAPKATPPTPEPPKPPTPEPPKPKATPPPEPPAPAPTPTSPSEKDVRALTGDDLRKLSRDSLEDLLAEHERELTPAQQAVVADIIDGWSSEADSEHEEAPPPPKPARRLSSGEQFQRAIGATPPKAPPPKNDDRGAPEAKKAPSPPPPEAVSPGTPTTRDSWLVEPLPDVTPPHNSPPPVSRTKSGEEGLLEWIEANGASKFRAAILDVAGDLDDLKHITEQDFEELVKGMPKLKARRLRASLVELGARLA